MIHSHRSSLAATAVLVASLTVTLTLCADRSMAQEPANDPNSKDRELIARAPFDRITLIDDTSWDIETLAPRPLPPFDPKKVKAKQKKTTEPPPSAGNIGQIGEKSTFEPAKVKDDEDDGSQIIVHMLTGDIRDFKVGRENIKSLLYYEDLLILEAGKLISAAQYRKAFEYLLLVKRRQPGWRGLDEMVNRLLYEEGSQALAENDGERGLRLLHELNARQPSYPGLANKLALSFAARINGAFDVGSYSRGRQLLHEIEAFAPGHQVVTEAHARYEGRAKELVEKAKQVGESEKLDLLLAAVEVWPKLPGLDSAYRDAFAAVRTLDVAVSDLPRPVGPWSRSPAMERTSTLLYRPILTSTSEDALKGLPADQLASGVESFDLSRGLRITLKPGFRWNDGSRPVSAIDVARSLADRAVPTLPGYSARWADLLERVEVTEDDKVEIHLSRPSYRPELWLVAPVGPAHARGDGWVSTVGQGRQPVGDGPFRWTKSSSTRIGEYLRVQAGDAGSSRIRRIREVTYESPTAAFSALARGDMSLIEAIASDRVGELAKVEGIKVGRYTTPSLHRIALDGRTPFLRNRSLRRALSLAIDRKTLLEESVLKHSPEAGEAVADGPFLKGSYADVADVAPLSYDPLLAKMLVAAARKEAGGGVVRLTLEYPPSSVARAICPKLAEAWTLVGIEIVLKEVAEGELETKLRSGGRFDLAYQATRPGEPAMDAGPTICPGYDAPPSSDPLASVASPRILQLLMDLDRAPEATQSQALVRQIDRETRDELPILPLWQVVDHFAWRSRIKGIASEIADIYQGIETWEIEPWFPNDPW
jgi:peptide/nickel transport system substrate-binding protein